MKHPRAKKGLWILSVTTCMAILLVWAFHDTTLDQIAGVVRGASCKYLVLMLLAFPASVFVRAQRWGTLLSATSSPGTFHARQSALFIGVSMNGFLPGSAGEVVRALALHRETGIPTTTALGSIAVERLFDTAMVLMLIFIPLIAGGGKNGSDELLLAPLGWVTAGLALCALVLYAMKSRPALALGVSEWIVLRIGLGRFAAQISKNVSGLLSGLETLARPKVCIQAATETLLMWLLVVLGHWFCLEALHIVAPGFSGAMFVAGLTAIALALPLSPGAIGPYEGAAKLALGAYAVPVAGSAAYTLLMRFTLYLILVPIGVYFAARMGFSVSQLIFDSSAAHRFRDGRSPRIAN